MRSYVIDTSVVVKWFSQHDEKDLEKALALRDKIADGKCRGIVPDLLLYELANALRYNRNLNAGDVREAMESVIALGVDVRVVAQDILNHSIEIAYEHNITVYDAYFLALAVKEKKPLVTADYKLANRAKNFHLLIRLSALK